MPLDVGVARHSEKDASKRESMSCADVGSSAKLAHAWTPDLVRNCSVAKSIDEDTWHDLMDRLVCSEAKAELTIGDCKPIDKMPEGTAISQKEEKAAI